MSRTTSILRCLILVVFSVPIALTIIAIGLDDAVTGNCDPFLKDLRERWKKWVRENIVDEYPYDGRM